MSDRITDKQRLDWIQRHFAEIRSDSLGEAQTFVVTRVQSPAEQSRAPWSSWKDFGWHSTVRKAIDAAMRADKKGK